MRYLLMLMFIVATPNFSLGKGGDDANLGSTESTRHLRKNMPPLDKKLRESIRDAKTQPRNNELIFQKMKTILRSLNRVIKVNRKPEKGSAPCCPGGIRG